MSRRISHKAEPVVTVTFPRFGLAVKVSPGTNLLDAVQKAGLPIQASCGGKGTCGDCVVRILEGAYKTRSSAVLSKELASRDYVLACLTEVTGNLAVFLPHFEELSIKSVASFELLEDDKAVVSGARDIDPVIAEIDLEVSPPSLEVNYGDLTRVERELRKTLPAGDLTCEYSVVKSLPATLREGNGRISVVLFTDGPRRVVIDARSSRSGSGIYGIACDIGTTTVAVSLVDLRNGGILGTALGLNRQLKCGEDIISRINYAAKPGRLEELRDLVISTIHSLMDQIEAASGIPGSAVYCASVAGNTTMLHLFLSLEPRHIREEPYVPGFNRLPFVKARDIGLRLNPEARVYCAPAVGSYVGGDITAGLLATPMLLDSESVSMFIDAGTNGELVVGNKDWLMTCACSAGPAFEGGGVRCGMPASRGAIESIEMTTAGEIEYRVIEDAKPRGVCGSGLVDILAELLCRGYIDRQGRFRQERAGERLVENQDGIGFLIEHGRDTHWGHDLVITERDISNLIRTKGAVFSACSLLLRRAGLTFDKIDSFYVAGGFGHHLDIENAIRIGLLPDLERRRFHYLGNTSLLGAYLILVSDRNRKMVEEVADRMTYVELNTEPAYMNEYTGALFLPHTNLDLFPSLKKGSRRRGRSSKQGKNR